jgi:hypothetical protein
MASLGYCIFTDTLFQGMTPVERDENGNWVIYETEAQAEASIEDDNQEFLRQYLAGEREMEEGIESDDVVCQVTCLPNGSVVDEWGRVFKPK